MNEIREILKTGCKRKSLFKELDFLDNCSGRDGVRIMVPEVCDAVIKLFTFLRSVRCTV